MKLNFALRSPALPHLLLAAVACLPLGFACSSDDSAPETPITFGVSITRLDGVVPGKAPQVLHCDGTLAVEVALSSDSDTRTFVLAPSKACGASTRCGYVRLRALDENGEELARLDTATITGVLRLPEDRLGEVREVTAQLIHGTDDQPVLNPDQSEVTDSVTPGFEVPSNCPPPDSGSGGASSGGAGAGGDAATAEVAGAPSAGGAPGIGGAPGAAGDAPDGTAGAGEAGSTSGGAGG